MKTLDTIAVAGKRVFLRVDFNVPLDASFHVTDDIRIRAVLPSIEKVLSGGGRLILASHFGRPKGKPVPEMSLRPAADRLSEILGRPVPLAPDCVGAEVEGLVASMKPGDLLLLENLRFHAEEEKDDPAFAKALAAFCDVYVNDAFSASHRAHASVHAITKYVAECAAGYQLAKEVEYFQRVMVTPRRPLGLIIGGAKVSTKIGLLENLIPRADALIIGGAMANTFLKAKGLPVGTSLVEDDYVPEAARLLEQAARKGLAVTLPVDVVIARSLKDVSVVREVPVEAVPPDMAILDVGEKTLAGYRQALAPCGTIVWNGPVGAFETPPFEKGTFALARYLGTLSALTVAGGGDSAAALEQAGARVSYVSTGGGAFLEMLEGKTLPGIAALDACGA